jgi:hypothetical protein
MWDLSKEAKFVRLNAPVAAGLTTVTTAAFNMQGQASAGKYTNWPAGGTVAAATVPAGFDALCVIVVLNTVTAGAVMTVNVQDAPASGGPYTTVGASYGDFASNNPANASVVQQSTNAGIVVTDIGGLTSTNLIVLDVALIQGQYVQVVVQRATANAALDGIIGLVYRSKARPVIHDPTVSAMGYFVANS